MILIAVIGAVMSRGARAPHPWPAAPRPASRGSRR
jgi:hypothetical protein